MLVYAGMKKIFQFVLAGLLALSPAAWAVQLSDLSPDLTRTAADENLTKDYAYRVLSDMSVRRIWNLDDNRKLTIDFDPRKDSLICIVVDYRKPVTLEEADKDAADIGKFEEASWRKFSSDKAAKYFMGRSRAMKFSQGYMFQELNGANKCARLTFYTKQPKENRRHLSEGSTASGATALGNSGGGNAVKQLLDDEEKRLFTPNKTDKPSTSTVKKNKPIEIEPDETFEEEPETTPEEVVDVEPSDDKVVVKTPIPVKPVKTVQKKGDRDKDVDGLLSKLGLDKLEPIHWILGGVGLLILISVLGVAGRNKERRKLEERAARLRNGSASVKASLRASVTGSKGGKMKLK